MSDYRFLASVSGNHQWTISDWHVTAWGQTIQVPAVLILIRLTPDQQSRLLMNKSGTNVEHAVVEHGDRGRRVGRPGVGVTQFLCLSGAAALDLQVSASEGTNQDG